MFHQGERSMPQRDQIFVSYSHADAKYLQRLRVHFKPFEKQYSIKVWSDERIHPGQQWRNEIKKALQKTAVAILLISADFLASDFITDEELPPLLDAAQSEGVSILCFILSHCSFSSSPLSKYQTVNEPNKPLTSFNKKAVREALWVDLVEQARRSLEKFRAQETAANAAQRVTHSRASPRWDKVATLFWLGNDLMWIQDMTYRGAEPKRVFQGINHCIEYIENLGFDHRSLPSKELTRARKRIEPFLDLQEIGEEKPEYSIEESYKSVRQHIETIKWFLHELASQQERDFKKHRAYWWME
jgi:hypothetical protein